jgi:hypothetical protein
MKPTETDKGHCSPSDWQSQHTHLIGSYRICLGTQQMCQQSGGQTPDGCKSNAFAAEIILSNGFSVEPKVSVAFYSPNNSCAPPLQVDEIAFPAVYPHFTRCYVWTTTGGPQVADDYLCIYSIVGIPYS